MTKLTTLLKNNWYLVIVALLLISSAVFFFLSRQEQAQTKNVVGTADEDGTATVSDLDQNNVVAQEKQKSQQIIEEENIDVDNITPEEQAKVSVLTLQEAHINDHSTIENCWIVFGD